MTDANANRPPLPIDAALPEIDGGLGRGHVVLVAPPGSGKTTAVPPSLLDAEWLDGRRILMLEPRRPAARMAARRVAALLGESVGGRVGYQIRFERRAGPDTRIEIVTEGILTRRLQQDPELSEVGLVIFDEFHERSLQADLALALCLDVCAGLRDDLRLLVMSATLDDRRVDGLLAARRVSAEGRAHPVEILFLPEAGRARRAPEAPDRHIAGRLLPLIERACREVTGDLLVFLPGRGEIERLGEALAGDGLDADVLPLYGDLPGDAQDRVLQPTGTTRRRIILATDIAETSLTIPRVEAVIDSGLARKPDFDPNTGLTRLRTLRIARDAADQRAGRAGRLAPGRCYRAWSESEQRRMAPQTTPEIAQADLAPLALELARWGVAGPGALRWVDPPPAAHWSQAVDLLRRLGALDDRRRLTRRGRRMAELPLHPRLARMLIEAEARGQYRTGCDLAALLSERDPLPPAGTDRYGVDLLARLEALQGQRGGAPLPGFDSRRLAAVERVARQLFELRRSGGVEADDTPLSAGGLVSTAYPDRIAQRTPTPGRFLLASGGQVSLPEADRLSGLEWLVVPHLDGGRREARARLALPLDGGELFELHGPRMRRSSRPDWHPGSGAACLRSERRLDGLLIDTELSDAIEAETVHELLLAEVERQGLELLGWTRAARQLQARSEHYRRLMRPPDWPDLSDAWLRVHPRQWLAQWLTDATSLRQLRDLDLVAVLTAMLGWSRLQTLDRAMPVELVTPAGRRRTIRYDTEDGKPRLAVRLQELYGMADTPRIANGRISLVLHLLSPADRVLQITQDLGHFWRHGYQEVRKEMRGRYPKHDWPEDPLSATLAGGPKKHK